MAIFCVFPYLGINGGQRGNVHLFPHQTLMLLISGLWWHALGTSSVCIASGDLGVKYPVTPRWLYSYNLWHLRLSKFPKFHIFLKFYSILPTFLLATCWLSVEVVLGYLKVQCYIRKDVLVTCFSICKIMVLTGHKLDHPIILNFTGIFAECNVTKELKSGWRGRTLYLSKNCEKWMDTMSFGFYYVLLQKSYVYNANVTLLILFMAIAIILFT